MERAAKQEEDVTNLGMKIVGEELEVGFTVSSREEFDAAVARLQTVAETIWMSQHEPEPERALGANYAQERAEAHELRPTQYIKNAQAWREDQGLR